MFTFRRQFRRRQVRFQIGVFELESRSAPSGATADPPPPVQPPPAPPQYPCPPGELNPIIIQPISTPPVGTQPVLPC